jgi:hypothetical protein
MSETSSVRPPRPTSVWIVYLILFCQGAAIIGGTVITTLSSDAQVLDTAGTVALTVLYILSGAVLVLLGFRIFLGSATARTPAMVLQLLIVVLSFSFFAGGALTTGLVFVVPAGTALVLLFIKPTAEWLEAGPG